MTPLNGHLDFQIFPEGFFLLPHFFYFGPLAIFAWPCLATFGQLPAPKTRYLTRYIYKVFFVKPL
jgi:hypothetical protein